MKRKLESLSNFQSKSVIVSPSISNVDVFSIVDDEKAAYVYFLKVVNGAVVQSHALEVKKRLEESLEEILELAIVEISTSLRVVLAKLWFLFRCILSGWCKVYCSQTRR